MLITSGRTLDHVASLYDTLSPIMTFFQEGRFFNKVIGLLKLNGHEKILDVGCGTGMLTIKLAKELGEKNGSLIIGLDAAPKMIEVAKRKASPLKNIRFDAAIAEALPYKDRFFDYAVSSFFFHHVDFKLKKQCLREMWRVLKKNGKAIIVDIDIPLNFLGRLCAYSGYWLFQQEEIRENIQGKLREAFNESEFRGWHRISTHLGYLSIFELLK